MRIGILALQGAYVKHQEMLNRLGCRSIFVRFPHDLVGLDALLLPGGESTSMHYQLVRTGLLSPIKEFACSHPVFGTCAGLILLADWGLLDITVARNAYGRQAASFSKELEIKLTPPKKIEAVFIRAPKIEKIHSSEIEVLADTPVFIRQGKYLAATFHPELTNDPSIHHYFIQLCEKKL